MIDFTVKTAEQIRDDILRTYGYGLAKTGIVNPNVAPGSDIYILAQAIGNQLEVAMANGQVQADGLMPDTAATDELDRWLAVFGLSRRSAAGATGAVIFDTTASTLIAVGTQLTDALGLRYQVTVGGSYADGDTIPVAAIDTGSETNHEAGDTLRWVTPPPFASPTVVVASGDLTGGVDEEDDETARQRLFVRLRNPPASGNWAHVAELTEASSSLIQKAFVYPCVNGPASVGVAVAGYTSAASKSRQVSSLIVTNTIKPHLAGQYPEHADFVVNSVLDQQVDLALALTLPASPKGSPPGPGGGWTDGTTWPRNANVASTFTASVTAVTSSTTFTVTAPSAPTAGVTQICWLSPIDWNVYTATITSYTVATNNYTITVDNPFPNIAVGHYISPNAVNASVYFQSILDHFANMGPGELYASSHALFGRAFRHPPPSQSWPSKMDASFLRAVVLSSEEVQDADFYYGGNVAPTIPASSLYSSNYNAPYIFIPGNIAFYEKLT